jgi:hypothetical protein
LTIQRLLDVASKSPELMKYVPPEAEKFITKKFLLETFSTFDATLLPRLMNELDEKVFKSQEKHEENSFSVTPEMMALLKKFSSSKKVKANSTSLAQLQGKERKKRKRP